MPYKKHQISKHLITNWKQYIVETWSKHHTSSTSKLMLAQDARQARYYQNTKSVKYGNFTYLHFRLLHKKILHGVAWRLQK